MPEKLRLGVIFGGQSVEHEVSVHSAQAVLRAADSSLYDVVPIGGVADGSGCAGCRSVCEDRLRGRFCGRLVQFIHETGEDIVIGEVEAGGILPGAENIPGQRDLRMWRANRRDGERHFGRIGRKFVHGHGVVADAIDEGAVGAVLEQAPDEVRQ